MSKDPSEKLAGRAAQAIIRGINWLVNLAVKIPRVFVADEEAESLLGVEQFVYTPGGIKPNPTEEEKASGTVFEQYKSPDTLWIFRKESVKSE